MSNNKIHKKIKEAFNRGFNNYVILFSSAAGKFLLTVPKLILNTDKLAKNQNKLYLRIPRLL